jgi:2-polyprenyl-3-methyl-5-hydroxy-6-metoxy-1,4-benzoquinol methylase
MSSRTCPACASTEHRLYGRFRDEEYFCCEDAFDYWQCDACATVFLHPLPIARLAEIYPSNYYSFQPHSRSLTVRIKEQLDRRYFQGILRKLPGDSIRVLDVGGGTGWLLDVLRTLDPRVRFTQIVDLDPEAGDKARAKGHAYACQRIEDFVTDGRFDLVLMLNLIEHVEAPQRVLAKVANLLSPSGIVLVKTPNMDAMDARLFRNAYWAGLHVPRHWSLFTRSSFERMIGGTGLEMRRFQYTQGAPFWAASVLASLKRSGLVDISARRPAVYHPLFGPLSALFAAFDIVRAPFGRPSQMYIVMGKPAAAA